MLLGSEEDQRLYKERVAEKSKNLRILRNALSETRTGKSLAKDAVPIYGLHKT